MKAKYDKSYEATEDAQRFEIFKKNVAEFEAHNQKHAAGLVTFTKGLNKFADWTPEENNALRGVNQP